MNRQLPKILVALCLLITHKAISQKIALKPYISGFNNPIDIKNCGDNRLFVATQDGRLWVVNANGTLRTTPFLDISSKIRTGPEDGLLGFAFSPNYKMDGKFYVYYMATVAGKATSVFEQYKVNATDSNLANLASALTIITQTQPVDMHVGGNIMFGKDGYLYINLGDGAVVDDSLHTGQDLTTLMGKILRIDVSNSSASQRYTIPTTNPFYHSTTPGIKKEIWAYGVRNPWRSSVDRITGDLWIADVGEYYYEEVDYHPAGQAMPAGGINYGWSIMEGDSCYKPTRGCNKSGITMPVYQYPHPPLGPGCIIGGYVYRSAQSKALFGTYIFADWSLKWIKGIKLNGGVVTDPATNFLSGAQLPGSPISFGEDWMGDLYVVMGATVYKISDSSYQRHPKAYYTATDAGGGTTYLLQGLQGKDLTYQWLKNNEPIPGAVLPNYTVTTGGDYRLVVTNALKLTDTSNVFSYKSSPLDIVSFTAQKTVSGQVALQWKTAYERNVKGYTIQRKRDNETDFSKIGFVASKAGMGSNTEISYNCMDTSIFTQRKVFYRLKIEYTDGSFSYSNIVYLTSDQTKNGFSVFPNPASGQTQIYLNEYTHPVVMNVYNYIGKKVKQQTITQQSVTIDLPPSRGVYVIELSDEDGKNKVRKKLIVN